MIDSDAIQNYQYDLPSDRIPEYPLSQRDQSKLLVYKDQRIEDAVFSDAGAFLPSNTLLIFNDTKVVQARFLFQIPTGATIEIFSLEPADGQGGPAESMMQKGQSVWKCFVGNAKKWKQEWLERTLQLANGELLVFQARQLAKHEDYYEIEFKWSDPYSFSEILTYLGDLPLPPYMKRKAEESDKERYQTVYAREEGSVAAPTAGLHFTPELLERLSKKGIEKEFVTLHVGAGTFKPVKTDSILNHSMHSEYISVKPDIIEKLAAYESYTIIPVGTTSLRTLESLYWLGCKLHADAVTTSIPELKQWDAYELTPVPVRKSMERLLDYMKRHQLKVFSARTSLLIKPGYTFKICDAIFTNFHQPQSTLMCLVSAFVGMDELKRIYTHALENQYRFLSYGDSSLLFHSK